MYVGLRSSGLGIAGFGACLILGLGTLTNRVALYKVFRTDSDSKPARLRVYEDSTPDSVQHMAYTTMPQARTFPILKRHLRVEDGKFEGSGLVFLNTTSS